VKSNTMITQLTQVFKKSRLWSPLPRNSTRHHFQVQSVNRLNFAALSLEFSKGRGDDLYVQGKLNKSRIQQNKIQAIWSSFGQSTKATK